ncbi:MAG: hypothetical protein ACLUUG_06550 [Lachnospiraceae bacterium]
MAALDAELCKYSESDDEESSGSRTVETIIHADDESGNGCGQVSAFIQRDLVSAGVIEQFLV